ncbi:50S ribosomal protein L10 [Candidatus Beckwithbacteria bacterium]|nr:50S ribosomal protein L10 [Candidatus Beckwithbacteria bacterium]
MSNQQNVNQLKVIKEKKDQAKSVVFIHYRGISAKDISNLRNKIKETGAEMSVFKNTLLRIAFDKKELNENLTGPTATVFSYEDEIAPIKVLADFGKTNEAAQFTGGILEDKVLTAEDIKKLAELPGKQELRAKVVSTIAAPLSGMVNVLAGNLRNLVYVLNAIKEKQS